MSTVETVRRRATDAAAKPGRLVVKKVARQLWFGEVERTYIAIHQRRRSQPELRKDAVVRGTVAGSGVQMYYDAFPHIKGEVVYQVAVVAGAVGGRGWRPVLPPPVSCSGLRYGTRVVITGDGEFAGETGVVKRVNGDTNEVLVAIDGAPDMVWMPVYAVNIDGDGL